MRFALSMSIAILGVACGAKKPASTTHGEDPPTVLVGGGDVGRDNKGWYCYREEDDGTAFSWCARTQAGCELEASEARLVVQGCEPQAHAYCYDDDATGETFCPATLAECQSESDACREE